MHLKIKYFHFSSGDYYYDLEEETSEKDNEESQKDKASVSESEKLLIDLNKVLDSKLVDKYFYENYLKEIVKQLKDLRRQDNKRLNIITKKHY